MPEANDARGSNVGRMTVGAVLLVAIVLGTIAMLYWMNAVTVEKPSQGVDRPFDRDAAVKELTLIEDELAEAKRLRRYSGVLQRARAFVARYPGFADGYVVLAKVHIELDEREQALAQLKTALDIEPHQPEIHHLAGTVQYLLGDLDKADHHYQMAKQLEPNNPKHLVYQAQVDIKRDAFQQATLKLLEAIEMDRQFHQAYATMSDLYMVQNKAEMALQQIDKAIAASNSLDAKLNRELMINYLLKRAAIQRRLGDPDGAILTLHEGLQPDELNELRVAEDIALSWSAMGMADKAAEYMETAFTAHGRADWRMLAAATRWRIKHGDFETARKHISELRRLDPRLPAIVELEEALQLAEKRAVQAEPLQVPDR